LGAGYIRHETPPCPLDVACRFKQWKKGSQAQKIRPDALDTAAARHARMDRRTSLEHFQNSRKWKISVQFQDALSYFPNRLMPSMHAMESAEATPFFKFASKEFSQ
jgi:hypothetical protein